MKIDQMCTTTIDHHTLVTERCRCGSVRHGYYVRDGGFVNLERHECNDCYRRRQNALWRSESCRCGQTWLNRRSEPITLNRWECGDCGDRADLLTRVGLKVTGIDRNGDGFGFTFEDGVTLWLSSPNDQDISMWFESA